MPAIAMEWPSCSTSSTTIWDPKGTTSAILAPISLVDTTPPGARRSTTTGVWREVARLVSRPCRRRRPSSLDDGGISGLFSSGGPSVRFLTRYDGEVSEPRVGRRGSRVCIREARGSASLLPSHGRGIWPRDVLKKVSRGLSRVEAGNPGFPRLVQVTSGASHGGSEKPGKLEVGGASRDSTGLGALEEGLISS